MDPAICPSCGTPLASDAAQGLCPRCLLEQAAASGTFGYGAGGPPAPGTPAKARVRYIGDYELLDEIASGGMGVVYRARQSSLNRNVALKMILAGQFADDAEVKRFHAEAEAAASLDHPNIVPIYEVGEHEGRHYFSMKLVEGGNLARKISGKPLPVREAAELARTIATAIHFAHQKGVLHRDLKPANILLDNDGQPHITDFGLAKRVESRSDLTESGAIVGTPSYMAPEQASGRAKWVTAQADIFSLGAILYHMLTGAAPFIAPNAAATMLKVINDEPPRPLALNPRLPADLETICLKCLEKSPARRYSTTAELSADLERFLNHEPILARPVGAATRAWHWVSKSPWALAGIASILLVALLCVVAGLWTKIQYMEWLKMQPPGVTAPAERVSDAEISSELLNVVFAMAMIAFPLIVLYIRKTEKRGQLPPPRILMAIGAAGALGVVAGLLVLLKQVGRYVWFGKVELSQIFGTVYFLLFFGISSILIAIKKHNQYLYGSEAERKPHEGAAARSELDVRRFAAALLLMSAATVALVLQFGGVHWAGWLISIGFGILLMIAIMLSNRYLLARTKLRFLAIFLFFMVWAGISELLRIYLPEFRNADGFVLGVMEGALLMMICHRKKRVEEIQASV